jgi:hypothetical protein
MATETKKPPILVHSMDENSSGKGYKCLHCGYQLPPYINCEDYATLAVREDLEDVSLMQKIRGKKPKVVRVSVWIPNDTEEDLYDCKRFI